MARNVREKQLLDDKHAQKCPGVRQHAWTCLGMLWRALGRQNMFSMKVKTDGG